MVAYDLGRSTARAALFSGSERIAAATEPAEGSVIDAGGSDGVAGSIRRLATRLPDGGSAAAVVIGLTGVAQHPARAAALERLLHDLHGAPRTIVTSDVVIAHAGALGGGPGVVIVAGTGAVALGVTGAGGHVRVDGWGYLLGDAGSAYAIGRAGLDRALRAHDGRGPSTALLDRARRAFGPPTGIPARVHAQRDPARVIAAFAAEVAEAARAGDELALRIWDDAADELATAAAAAVARLRSVAGADPASTGPVIVSWAGGSFTHADLLVGPLRRRLEDTDPHVEVTPPLGDPLDGAALLGRDPGTCLETVIERHSDAVAEDEYDHGPETEDPHEDRTDGHDRVSQMGGRR